MRYKNKTKSIRIVLRLIVGFTTILFVFSLTNALNAESFSSHKERFSKAKRVKCGDTLKYGHFELRGDLTCSKDPDNDDKPAIEITGPAKLNLNGNTLSGDGKIGCIIITGEGARVRNGTLENCKNGILIEESHHNMIINVEASNNDKRGFIIVKGHDNILFDCIAKDNDKQGFLIEGGNGNKMVKCLAEDNSKEGFSVEEGTGNKMVKCKAKNNDEKGFSIKDNGDDNQLFWCVAENNGEQGFIIEEGAGNKIYYSEAYANCRDGIEIDGGSENKIINNLVEDNGNEEACEGDFSPWSYAGIDVLSGSKDNKIKYNHACGNIGCNDVDCTPRERNYWDENCEPTNEWENNTVCPECTPGP
jgi:parallel beta-helix repeat protein